MTGLRNQAGSTPWHTLDFCIVSIERGKLRVQAVFLKRFPHNGVLTEMIEQDLRNLVQVLDFGGYHGYLLLIAT